MTLPSIKNRVGMTVTGTPGTGTITLNAADTGYQSFATAYAADANVDILIEEGNTWEIARDCAYTNSGTTVTRGTLEASSTGSAVSFTSAAKVYVINSAERIRNAYEGYLSPTAHDGTANVTGVVGTLHIFTALTASRNFTLPATASFGDRVGVTFPNGSATYEILLYSASGDKINGTDASVTQWSRLFVPGEIAIFRCVDGTTNDWVVEQDGRIPCVGVVSGSVTTTATYTNTFPDYAVASTVEDKGGIVDVANDQFSFRRSGMYSVSGVSSMNQTSTGKLISITMSLYTATSSVIAGSTSVAEVASKIYAYGNTLKPAVSQGETASKSISYRFAVLEILQ